ncbi:MAG: hypothetical protein DRH08_08155 [Deltaproteobacteria bacterium]|nr:MAG: hypothetical protein DRH08_08155 [Deltaproteobacteria bacterium]
MIGLSLAMLPANDLTQARDQFWRLQERFALTACEVQTETATFPAALPPWDGHALAIGQSLRQTVSVLGLHLPYVDLNPVSFHPRIAAASQEILLEAIDAAAEIEADYVVFHVRNGSLPRDRKEGFADWLPILRKLNGRATDKGLRFLLENADDLRWIPDVLELATDAGVDICLDVGHLFERVYETPDWGVLQRVAARLQDIASPWPFLLPSMLPAAQVGGIAGLLTTHGKRVGCVHLHNHDGRSAHRPLAQGKIPWQKLAGHADQLRDIPIILEADYRKCSYECLEHDLSAVTRLLT